MPQNLSKHFSSLLSAADIPKENHATYLKWLRFYLDFCNKYEHDKNQKENLQKFMVKLSEKGQSAEHQSQAAHAVTLYYKLMQAPQFFSLISTREKRIAKAVKHRGILHLRLKFTPRTNGRKHVSS